MWGVVFKTFVNEKGLVSRMITSREGFIDKYWHMKKSQVMQKLVQVSSARQFRDHTTHQNEATIQKTRKMTKVCFPFFLQYFSSALEDFFDFR